MEKARFKFRPQLFISLFVIAFFGLAAFFLIRDTLTGTARVRLFYSIVIQPPTSIYILGALAVAAVVLTLMGALMLYQRLFGADQELVFFEDRAELPAQYFKPKYILYYKDIAAMQEFYRGKNNPIYVVSFKNSKKKWGFLASMFDSKDEYRKAVQTLNQLARGS
jgi:hypothetical protein